MPRRMMSLFRNLWRKRTVEQALDDELRSSVEILTEEKMKNGLARAAARRQALIELGGIEQVKEEVRAARLGRFLETLAQDVRYGLRMLRKSPGFTAIAVLTLALGIGATTALFSVVNGVVLNPLPYPQPDRLYELYSQTSLCNACSISYPDFVDWQRENQTFESLAAYRADNFNLTGSGEPERVTTEMTSADFFRVLGVKPIAGRTFTKDDDCAGGAPVVILSEGFWKRKFGGAPSMLGRAIVLNGVEYTVIGIIPQSFYFSGGNDFTLSDTYVPIGQWTEPGFLDRRVSMGMDAIGRLKPGVTAEQARWDMDRVAAELARQYPDVDSGSGVLMLPLKEAIVGGTARTLYLLLGAVGFLLLIACVNTANLLLTRATGRAREFAIRAALGAGRGRMLRQLLTESIILATLGGLLGLLFAAAGTKAAISILPDALPRASQVTVDTHVLLFTMGVSLLAGVLFGLAPAFAVRRFALQETLKESGRSSTGRHPLQGLLVIAEFALALVLLIGSGLLVRSLEEVWDVSPGFNPHNALSFNVSLPADVTSANPDALRAHIAQMDEDLRAIPGVEAVSSFWGSSPMGNNAEIPFWLAGQPKPASDNDLAHALFDYVTPDYLNALGIPLERGRFIDAQDTAHSQPVAVIDERFASAFFGGQDPIGKSIHLEILGAQVEIVGVVGHVKHWGLDSDASATLQAQLYLPLEQFPDPFLPMVSRSVSLISRTQSDPAAMANPIRQAIERQNSQQVVYDVETMDDVISRSLASRRFSVILLGGFAGLALLLSCIGIYGVISYLVGQRTHEVGIRMALGAQRRDVLGMVLRQGAALALIGVAVGIGVALGLTRLMASMLFGVTPHDPVTFACVAALLMAVALLACYIPARRATRVDPMIALRYE